LAEEFFAEYRSENIIQRLEVILAQLNEFFDHKINFANNIPDLSPTRLAKLRIQNMYKKIRHKYF
jgi:hypothetical protein